MVLANDVEDKPLSSQTPNVEAGLPTLPVEQSNPPQQFEDNSNVPKLSILQIFWLFFIKFGLFAWGGPVAQIALIKDYLVIQEEWITLARFNRVFAVYQILPGPEAAELCMFFGCLTGGRVGGIAAGLGFILPGFFLTLLASYLYVVLGFGNIYVEASFRALQPMVAAMVGCRSSLGRLTSSVPLQILRATHKIAEHTLVSHGSGKLSPWLVGYALLTALNSALRINW
jgi:chromate transport protein ChrA